METYDKFLEKVKEIGNIGQASGVLGWDQEVEMPPKGIEARSQQKSTLSKIEHRLLTGKEFDNLLQELEDEDLSMEKEAVLREVKNEKEKAEKVPESLKEKISQKESETVEKWKEAKQESDFSKARDDLEELIDLKREYAEHLDPDSEPYKVLFKDFEPYIRFETMEGIMEQLKEELIPLIEDIKESDVNPGEDTFRGEFPSEKQRDLNLELMKELGFEMEKGHFSTSEHPFTGGNQFDTRITTAFNEENLKEGLSATIHETGHGLYQQGLPEEHYATPLGEARDLSIHESQSRLWENHVGRSREFWNHFLPKLKEKFPEQFEEVSVEDCYESMNVVREDNRIRIYADEVTYHLHIILRFELGRKLVNGEIEVEELPALWNRKMEELLGVTPENDAEGVLQDIHWYWGSIGYFTTYSLGSVLAAQIFDQAESEIEELDGKIEKGEFSELREWLRENIHRHGRKYRSEELVEKVTGEKPTAEHFIEYIKRKYGELYEL